MRARMHGATATTAATTPMHFRTHTRSRSRALSTDCDHCRSSTIPRLVPLALARPPHHSQSQSFPSPTPPLTRARAFSAHNFLSLANFSCLFRIALSLLPTARLSLSTTLDISPRIPLLSCTVPPTLFPAEHLIAPYRTPSFFSFGSPFPLALTPSYILLFPDSVSSCPSSFPSGLLPSHPSVSLSMASSSALPTWHTGQPAWFTVQFATLVPSLLLSPSFTRAQRTRCSRTGARECNV